MRGYLQAFPVIGFLWQDVEPDEVRAFWHHMGDHFKSATVNKKDAIEMQLVAQALDLFGILNRDRFLKYFTTTIGRRIYTPFEIGNPQGGWDLWSQMVICVHENQHVVQHDRDGLSYETSYLADRAARARYEAEAYTSNLEMHFWRYGKIPPTRPFADLLLGYGCRPEDVEVTTQSLALSAISIQRGAIMNKTMHIALNWLNEHVVRLRALPLT